MISIAVVTVARSDFSILRPVMAKISSDPELTLQVFAAGMHLAPLYGLTVEAIIEAGFHVDERVEMLLASDTPEGTTKSIGLGMIGFAQVLARRRPDVLVVMGDRFEMFAAAAAALPFGIPVAHIHGGELTEGAIDDSLRHCITKLSHVHFTSTDEYRDRVIQLGEDPSRVYVSGAPALDNLAEITPLSRSNLEERYGLVLLEPPLLVNFHSTTLDLDSTQKDTIALMQALEASCKPVVFTAPNGDAGGALIRTILEERLKYHENWRFVPNLGVEAYYSLLPHCAALVGNSSSGIIEAASFKLPVVNIGIRQKGRIAGRNVVHVAPSKEDVANGIDRACSPEFRATLTNLHNPYSRGGATDVIISGLRAAARSKLIPKAFYDMKARSL